MFNPARLLACSISGLVLVAGLAAQTPRGSTPPPESRKRDAVSGQREVDLRPKFEAGRQTRYKFELTSANTLKAPNVPEIDGDQTLTQTIVLRLGAIKADADGATVELVYESIKARLETADFRASFDSASNTATGGGSGNSGGGNPIKPARPAVAPAQKPTNKKPATGPGAANKARTPDDPEMSELLADIMRPMVGTTLTLQVDPSGNIRSVSGGSALAGGGSLGAALGGLGGVAMPSASGSAASPMNWLITGPGQRGKVRVGETWTNNDSLAGTPIGGFQMTTRHTCRSATATSAELGFTGRADQASAGNAPSSGGPATGGLGALGGLGAFQLKESAYSGNYSWDLARGELSELTSTLRTTVAQGTGGESDTKLNAESRITVKRLK